MPRSAKGARLYLEQREGRGAVWIIRDGSKRIRTGRAHADRAGAERALADYLADKHTPVAKGRDTSVADVLLMYAETHREDPTPFHCRALAPFWHDKTLDDIDAATCRAYVASRPVKPQTARRELETLTAAIRFCAREKKTPIVLVTYPDKAAPKTRWMTRREVAALLRAAWRQGNRHLARFILLGVYTGTRHAALLRLHWRENVAGGWVDIERGVIHRRGLGQRQTRKRQPPVKINGKLLAHLRRWHRIDKGMGPVVSYDGTMIKKERRAWTRARAAAGLDRDITPHVMRHTTVTWLLQAGVSTWETAGFVGMSEKTVREVYGHHSPDFQRRAASAF